MPVRSATEPNVWPSHGATERVPQHAQRDDFEIGHRERARADFPIEGQNQRGALEAAPPIRIEHPRLRLDGISRPESDGADTNACGIRILACPGREIPRTRNAGAQGGRGSHEARPGWPLIPFPKEIDAFSTARFSNRLHWSRYRGRGRPHIPGL